MTSTTNPLAPDLEHILDHTRDLWEELRGNRIFITGGTGFFGCWLLESLAWANDRLDLDASVVVLTRNPASVASKAPHLAEHPSIELVAGDVRSFAFPTGDFTHVIHAATEATGPLNAEQPLTMLDTIVDGTRRALDFAAKFPGCKFLLTSSGAVYGRQPAEMTHIPEDFTGAPDATQPNAAYGEGKRVAELLSAVYSRNNDVQAKIARCFAFSGPYLPLDGAYAVGNFVNDILQNRPISIQSDGTARRSYLYAADLAIWLWTILMKGEVARPYNVGSDIDLSIAEVAGAVRAAAGSTVPISIAREPEPGVAPLRYVPSIKRARSELGLDVLIPFSDGLRNTIAWHRSR